MSRSYKRMSVEYGDSEFSYHRRIKKSDKKRNHKLMRVRLKRETLRNARED